MKMWYNSVALHDLGVLRILSKPTETHPPEAPHRERITLRVRLDFFAQTYIDNYSLVEDLRTALKTKEATLLWEERVVNSITFMLFWLLRYD